MVTLVESLWFQKVSTIENTVLLLCASVSHKSVCDRPLTSACSTIFVVLFSLFCCFKVTEQSSICVLKCYQLSVFLKIKLLYFMLFDADKFEPEAIIFYLTVVT